MDSLNRYSYVLFSLLVVGGLIGVSSWLHSSGLGLAALLVGAALIIFWVMARRGVPMPANPEKRIRRAREATRPLVVHFYSDFHLGSLVKRVVVGGAERAFLGRFEFIYINMNHRGAGEVADSLGARVGTFLLYDASGHLVAKVGRIDKARLAEILERPAK